MSFLPPSEAEPQLAWVSTNPAFFDAIISFDR
jgi:hypothetical protein